MIKSVVKWKLRLQYASSYFSIIGLPLLVVNLVQEKLMLVGININYFVLLLLGITGLFVFAYFLDSLGFWESENDFGYTKQKAMRKEINK
jgi:predicted permease